MGAYVPGYEYDIFVSYARVDDMVLPGGDEGWVTVLIKGLRAFLARKFGRADSYSVWMDPKLAGNVPITPAILDALGKSATLLVLLSPGYVASEWCRREQHAFLSRVGEWRRAGSRVFVVEVDRVPKDQYPAEFKDLRGYRFWTEEFDGAPTHTFGTPKPNEDDREYYSLLERLSHEIAEEVRQLKVKVSDGAPVEDTRRTVFLAEVTDDLEPVRNEVQTYLDQSGLRVLPESWYEREPARFQEQMEADLAKAKLFVQLLSGLAGKKLRGIPQTVARLQYETARRAQVPVLQWRSRDLDLTSVHDVSHSELLTRDTVRAVGIEEFKRTVAERALAAPTPPPQHPATTLVFVDAERDDRRLRDEIAQFLERRAVGWVFPLREGNPKEVREDLETKLAVCDGLIFVYGSVPTAWVHRQVMQWRKVSALRSETAQLLAVCEGPPPDEKPPLDMGLPGMRMFDCRRGLDEVGLSSFVDDLKAARA